MDSSLLSAFGRYRDGLKACAAFSFFINLLLFSAPLYMLQVYDRVLGSRSVQTLIMLTLILAGCLLLMGGLELIRSRILARIGFHFDRLISPVLFRAVFRRSLATGNPATAQALRDLDTLRDFATGPGIVVFLDAPWTPLFVILSFILHPVLGLVSLFGALAIFALAVANEVATRKSLKAASGEAVAAAGYAETSLKNVEVLQAMGMFSGIAERWGAKHLKVLSLNAHASERGSILSASSKFLRMFLQSLVLGIGAWLALHDQISAGSIIAGSIIMGRALAPVEMAVGHWKAFISARASYDRLNTLLRHMPEEDTKFALPKPVGHVSVERLIAAPPSSKHAILKGLNFELAAGECLGVVGPSAAGKSTLARCLVGVWPPLSGSIRLDQADLATWDSEQLGPYLGYLPQDIELFEGTIAENIARFGTIDAEAVVKAAQDAGVHEMILHLPQGYNTVLSAGGKQLSGGQRQRIGLARALYKDPVLIILDEPNSNLDSIGEQALMAALMGLKARKATSVVITHRLNILSLVDKIMLLREGQAELFGARDEIMAKLARPVVVSSSLENQTPPLSQSISHNGGE